MVKPLTHNKKILKALELMENFAGRTGLLGEKGNPHRRYLWTDAFAVQTFFRLNHNTGEEKFRHLALKLIDEVHGNLGKYREDDDRSGWLSGLPEEEGWEHPTIAGLRIGKNLPERKENEPYNVNLEWERDGQYFHYLTRWINTLLIAFKETGNQKFARMAAELAMAGERFTEESGSRIILYWKMSIDLNRPLVPTMGAHDALEGFICALSAQKAAPEKFAELEPMIEKMRMLCRGRDWFSTDPLGIGGLILNTLHIIALQEQDVDLPEDIRPEKLISESIKGLEYFVRLRETERPAQKRLPFRECGLSLGLRKILSHPKEKYYHTFKPYLPLADEIENFWSLDAHRQVTTWEDHQDINAVMLSASLAYS